MQFKHLDKKSAIVLAVVLVITCIGVVLSFVM